MLRYLCFPFLSATVLAASGFTCRMENTVPKPLENDGKVELLVWCSLAANKVKYDLRMFSLTEKPKYETVPAGAAPGFKHILKFKISEMLSKSLPGRYSFRLSLEYEGTTFKFEPMVDVCAELSCVDYKPTTTISFLKGTRGVTNTKTEAVVKALYNVKESTFKKNPVPIKVNCEHAIVKAPQGKKLEGLEACKWVEEHMKEFGDYSGMKATSTFSWTPKTSDIGGSVAACFSFTDRRGMFTPTVRKTGDQLYSQDDRMACMNLQVQTAPATTASPTPATTTSGTSQVAGSLGVFILSTAAMLSSW